MKYDKMMDNSDNMISDSWFDDFFNNLESLHVYQTKLHKDGIS